MSSINAGQLTVNNLILADWIAYFCPKREVLQPNSILYFVMLITLYSRTLYCAFFIYKRDLQSHRFSHNRSAYDQQKKFHTT